jgi:hypothetical protein
LIKSRKSTKRRKICLKLRWKSSRRKQSKLKKNLTLSYNGKKSLPGNKSESENVSGIKSDNARFNVNLSLYISLLLCKWCLILFNSSGSLIHPIRAARALKKRMRQNQDQRKEMAHQTTGFQRTERRAKIWMVLWTKDIRLQGHAKKTALLIWGIP